MRNKNVGWLIVGISVFIGAIIWIFNSGLKSALDATCSMGPTCGMYKTLSLQTWVSIAIAFVVFCIGLFMILSKENEKVVMKTRTVTEKRKPLDLSRLDKEEKEIVKIIQSENGAVFQSTLMEKIGKRKVGITRLLDRLEAKQIIERKRRGMNNIVVLKTQ